MGSPPSHPELLDWLARALLASGGSLKQLHRLIVTSAVYKQSAQDRPAFLTRDAENQWLWKQNRRRLDAESVHDAILRVADRLDTTMGGPSVQQFTLSAGVHVTPVVDYTRYNDITSVDKSFAHGRYDYELTDVLWGELFAQAQSDAFQRLTLRTLFGLGPRWQVFHTGTSHEVDGFLGS